MAENFGLVSKSTTTWGGSRPGQSWRNHVHLLRHPHSKRGAAGRQDRAESTVGGLLKRKYAHRKVLSQGNYASVIENRHNIRPKRPERDIKTEIWWPECRKRMGPVAASLKVKTLNDSPKFRHLIFHFVHLNSRNLSFYKTTFPEFSAFVHIVIDKMIKHLQTETKF